MLVTLPSSKLRDISSQVKTLTSVFLFLFPVYSFHSAFHPVCKLKNHNEKVQNVIWQGDRHLSINNVDHLNKWKSNGGLHTHVYRKIMSC